MTLPNTSTLTFLALLVTSSASPWAAAWTSSAGRDAVDRHAGTFGNRTQTVQDQKDLCGPLLDNESMWCDPGRRAW